ncbi:hypothetical protein [Gordonia malaquae]|uniref:hypothetical protein n=1 Tax=Gordonia malaquae TaxID=410332 RepID=UPI0030161AFC
MTTLAPIKVSCETDELVSHASHFMDVSKKEIVSRAVREYVDNHREEIDEGVKAALTRLDGSKKSAVALLTGMSDAEIADLGGVID